ncbi:hypothetical protein GCM10009122_00920 [Fulvivirga kasyanovii]|uniref:Nodulation protein Z (NodZ) n=1 Tax=Fulvivirga kasyanovii TaxID=396812 RepID=A0ABW9RLS6_9BACT|nr:hypothetical protein [Fulvivirga kasyanovii]MTI24304.1 hypothetical protein [Fulvivirga kasyanovii]
MSKRSIVAIDRQAQLKVEGAIYEVSCAIDGCPCGMPEHGCGRGFFSLFIQAIYGIEFAGRHQMPYRINFGNSSYPYSDYEKMGDNNFWNYYFQQPIPASGEGVTLSNKFNEVYPLRIWSRTFFRNIYGSVIQRLKYQPEVKAILDDTKKRFEGCHVLGVHFRGTDHPGEIPPVGLEKYLAEVDKRIKHVDKLFLATDEQYIVDLFSDKYGDKLIINEVVRSLNREAVHANLQISDRYQLGLDALVDCYSLSLCTSAILTHSNLSYAALFFNPELKYRLMERWQPKVKRFKTLILYYLDKWGVRKW